MISWTATGAMLSGWGSLAGAAAVVYAAYKAATTVQDWREKKVEERKLEHAERVLVATYKVRDAMRMIRSPMQHGVERKAALDELEKDESWATVPEDRRYQYVTAQVYIHRIRQSEDVWDELFNVLPLSKALFGEELEKAIEKLAHQRWITRVNVESLADDKGGDKDFMVKVRRELNSSDENKNDDDVSVAIKDAIRSIETVCLPLLRPDRRG